MINRIVFDLQYRFSKPPWDSGVTPPEVVESIEGGLVAPGRALDLGCGTGTNSIYLARHGFTTFGVDYSPKAIATARAKARRAGVVVDWQVADATRLDFLNAPFDFVLDIGCLHTVDPTERARYAANLARLTRAGSLYMLYAFSPRPADQTGGMIKLRAFGMTPEQVQRTFEQDYALERVVQGADRGNRPSAWYWFKRR
jgi:SAM-dependent methyltransferase